MANEDRKLLQALVDNLAAFRLEATKRFDKLEKRIDDAEKRLTARIDNIGASVAYLEDDSPTIRDFYKLEKRVTKLERQVATN